MSEEKRAAYIRMLKATAHNTDKGVWVAPPVCHNCAWELAEAGLVTPSREITLAGRIALFLLNEGPDPAHQHHRIMQLASFRRKE